MNNILSFDYPFPTVKFAYKFFCFTGHFLSIKRTFCEDEVIRSGGIIKSNNRLTNYLVIGAGLYGLMDKPQPFFNNKIDCALALRESGSSISIISEDHFKKSLEEKRECPLNEKLHLESFTTPGKEYEINLPELTCTCLNFAEDRLKYQKNDPRRLCKHMVKTLVDYEYVPDGLNIYAEKIAVAAFYRGGFPGYESKNPYVAF